jgi:hypothetical protein
MAKGGNGDTGQQSRRPPGGAAALGKPGPGRGTPQESPRRSSMLAEPRVPIALANEGHGGRRPAGPTMRPNSSRQGPPAYADGWRRHLARSTMEIGRGDEVAPRICPVSLRAGQQPALQLPAQSPTSRRRNVVLGPTGSPSWHGSVTLRLPWTLRSGARSGAAGGPGSAASSAFVTRWTSARTPPPPPMGSAKLALMLLLQPCCLRGYTGRKVCSQARGAAPRTVAKSPLSLTITGLCRTAGSASPSALPGPSTRRGSPSRSARSRALDERVGENGRARCVTRSSRSG